MSAYREISDENDELLVDAMIDKAYPGCVVLRAATIAIRRGTVHALVGENGAGKSTLVKILAGVLRADAGALVLGGTKRPLDAWTRATARGAGVGIVQQHGAFAETLTVVENAVLGTEGGPLLTLGPTSAALATLAKELGLAIDPSSIAGELSVGAAQRAEIIAALADVQRGESLSAGPLLILDEPTAVLAPVEVAGLLTMMRSLAERGITVLFVTHKLDEVREVADDVTVLREGETVATFAKRDAPLDTAAIARAMVGADVPPPQQVPAPSESAMAALELRAVSAVGLVDASLVVRAGEIVGVAGIDGNGQSELARAIAGLLPIARGTIELAGTPITRRSPGARLRAGLAHVHEDRHHGGLLLDGSVAENLALGRTDITGRFRLDRARVEAFARERIADLDIRPPDPAAMVRALSGGNQQKIVVARELSRPSIACVVASQPTRGVDLGAVARIHERLRDAARGGAGVLVISADLDELLALCHRIVVMLRGRIVGERAGEALHAADARAQIGTLMTGAA
ncbi:MAG: ABC transporter ATP-binding protein [Kofleriaceae bacterium]